MLMILSCSIIIPQHSDAQAGRSGLSFLKIGISGRGVSMGDAMSADVSGAAATYYNPAGLLRSGDGHASSQIMVMHKEWIQDTRMQFLGAQVALDDDNALGFSLINTTISDIEIRTRPGGPEGTFSARNYALGASYARRLSDDLHVGITGKFLYEKILIDEASGAAVDLGLQYRTPVEGLTVGAAVANLGSLNDLRNEKTKLPALVRAGPSYSTSTDGIHSSLVIAADILYIFPDKRARLNFGGELFFQESVAARAGYQIGSEGRGFSTGLGLRYGIIIVDYAFALLALDLGQTHTISVGLNL